MIVSNQAVKSKAKPFKNSISSFMAKIIINTFKVIKIYNRNTIFMPATPQNSIICFNQIPSLSIQASSKTIDMNILLAGDVCKNPNT
ncbi:hypothetical protein KR52_11475 [Synechococcus sp. KORDI-52]|nr:hypothetical protein KR52_11475 [Synechococcus sp. KORDI-52]